MQRARCGTGFRRNGRIAILPETHRTLPRRRLVAAALQRVEAADEVRLAIFAERDENTCRKEMTRSF